MKKLIAQSSLQTRPAIRLNESKCTNDISGHALVFLLLSFSGITGEILYVFLCALI